MDRDEIRRELATARDDAQRLAAEQQAWRERVFALFEEARAAGLTVDEIVEALGLSGKWTEHLQRRRKQPTSYPFFFGRP